MNKHLALITAALIALLVPVSAAQAAPAKAKVRFGATTFAVAENGGSAAVAVTRSARNGKSKSATNNIVTVGYTTSNGTAVAGTDYTAASGRLSFPACGPSPAAADPCLVQMIHVAINDDNVVNGNRTVKLALTSPSRNAVVVNPQKATLTIADNEGPNRVTFDSADYKVWELGPQAEIHVIRSGVGISGSSSVDFSTADGSAGAPGDYTATSATLAYGAGEVDKTVLVPITDDSAVEPTETFDVHLTNASGGTTIDTPSAPVTILDDDVVVAPHIGFDVSALSVNEGGDVTITVNRTASIDSAVSIDYATAAQTATPDVDFTAGADTLDFDPGDTSQSFTVSTLGDSLHEGSETFALSLFNAIPGSTILDTATTTVTIADDDPVPTISAGNGSVSDGTLTFDIVLSNPTTSLVTVTYTVTDGAGNTVATGTATIPAGSTGTTVHVPVTGEGPFTITLTNPTGGTIDPVGGTSSTKPASGGDTTGTAASSPPVDQGTTEQPTSQTPVTPASRDAIQLLAAGMSACRLSVKVAKRVDRRNGLVVKLRAGRNCAVTLGANVKGTGGKRTGSTKVLRALKTKRQTLNLVKGETRTVKLRFSKRALGFIKRALDARRPMTLSLAVIERDTAKRVSKRTTRTKLRR
ncbi:MAG: Calx-beta domain-containing protein [Thermoleophilaceae bacterium]